MKNFGCKHLCHCLIPDTSATIVELWHHLTCMFEVFYFHQLWCHKTAHLKQTQYTSINSAIIPNKIVLTVSLSYSEFCFIQYLVLGLRFLLLIPTQDMFITKVISGKAQVLRIWTTPLNQSRPFLGIDIRTNRLPWLLPAAHWHNNNAPHRSENPSVTSNSWFSHQK